MDTRADPPSADYRVPAPPVRAADWMPVAMSRLLRNGERVFHGVASPLPMVAILLARRTHAPDLVYLNITGSVNPRPSELPRSTTAPQLLEGSAALVTLADLFDLSARGGLDTAFLGGVQIDGRGRINMSVIGAFHHPTVRLPGGAGSALVLPTAHRTILWRTQHTPRSLVERLDFVTAAGHVDRLVTPLCVFRMEPGGFVLESLRPGITADDVRAATGFRYRCPEDTSTLTPTAEEMQTLTEVDPLGVREVEFG
jgi:glutaconate CoA-transferase subunit B